MQFYKFLNDTQANSRPFDPLGRLGAKKTLEHMWQIVLGDTHAMVVRSETKVTRKVMEAAPNLQVVGRAGVRVDNANVEAATERGIVVMNTPGGNTVTTAEHALSMLFSLTRNVPQASASMKAGRWEKKKFQGVISKRF